MQIPYFLHEIFSGEFVGWLYDGDYCKQSIETAGLQVYGGFYNDGNRQFSSFKVGLMSVLSLFILWNC